MRLFIKEVLSRDEFNLKLGTIIKAMEYNCSFTMYFYIVKTLIFQVAGKYRTLPATTCLINLIHSFTHCVLIDICVVTHMLHMCMWSYKEIDAHTYFCHLLLNIKPSWFFQCIWEMARKRTDRVQNFPLQRLNNKNNRNVSNLSLF